MVCLTTIAIGLAVVGLVIYLVYYCMHDPTYVKPETFLIPENDFNSKADFRNVATEDKFLVVGAGFCGLGLSVALKRHNIPYDVVEADDKLGGNWNHGVYETVHIISSRITTEYKDWPMPSHYSQFPSAKQMCQYFNDYADHFDVRKYIQFNKRLVKCTPIDGGRKWEARITTTRRNEQGQLENVGPEEVRIYKGVCIANGHHWSCRMPNYEGQDKFQGEIIHSKNYKKPTLLVGKRVLVVGGGNSACDIAVESGRFAEAAHISMRRGYWFLPRTLFGVPFVEIVRPWMPLWFQRLLACSILRVVVGRYESYGLQKPDHKLFEHHPTINSELLHYLKLGDITPHPDIKRFVPNSKVVEFIDGKREEFDLVVFCTGYNIDLPMLDSNIVTYKEGIPQLVRGIMSEHYRNMYVFGIGQPRYGAGPLITAGADLLARTIMVQEKLVHPIGMLMKKLGQGPPKKSPKSADYIVDPHDAFTQMMNGRMFVAYMPLVEKAMMALGMLPTTSKAK